MARFRTFAELKPGDFFCRQSDCAGEGRNLPVYIKLELDQDPSAEASLAMRLQDEDNPTAEAIILSKKEEVRLLAFNG